MEKNYYWNPKDPKPYTTCQPANKGSIAPRNATRTAPPKATPGKWPCWTGTGWTLIEKHIGEKGWVNGQPFEIKDWGPYPEGWSTTPPPPTAEEIKAQEVAKLEGELAAIDMKTIRPLRAVAKGTAVQADHDRLAALETEAAAKRAELAELL